MSVFLVLTVESTGTRRHAFLGSVILCADRVGMPCSYQFGTDFLYYFRTTVTKLLDIDILEEKTFIWLLVSDSSVHYGREGMAQGSCIQRGLDQRKKMARDTLRTLLTPSDLFFSPRFHPRKPPESVEMVSPAMCSSHESVGNIESDLKSSYSKI